MQKYKVELTQSEKFVIDVKAESVEQAEKLAKKYFNRVVENGTAHYYSTTGGVETEVNYVYDVSETDDPFNPEN